MDIRWGPSTGLQRVPAWVGWKHAKMWPKTSELDSGRSPRLTIWNKELGKVFLSVSVSIPEMVGVQDNITNDLAETLHCAINTKTKRHNGKKLQIQVKTQNKDVFKQRVYIQKR